jgi:hypothetical protein
MKKITFTLAAIVLTSNVCAQEVGYADYDQGARSDQVKAPFNTGHAVGSAINKARRNLNDQLGKLGDAQLDGSQSTFMNGRDVVNVGGLVVNSDQPVNVGGNIIIISRPGGASGLDGQAERPQPRRR